MHAAQLLLTVLCAGLASQWLASRVKLPAIVVLIAVGLVLTAVFVPCAFITGISCSIRVVFPVPEKALKDTAGG